MSDVPPPLEWHPWYRDKTWLLDWLERRGPYADLHDIRIPIVKSLRLTFNPEIEARFDPTPQCHIMTRRRCVGLAPYVGHPFRYEWAVGVDGLGRCIAGEAHRVPEPHGSAQVFEPFDEEANE